MSDMNPQQIMDALQKLYGEIDSMGYSQVRPAVKKAISCAFYLAKAVATLQGQPVPKTMKLTTKKKPAKKKPKRKASHKRVR